MTINVGGCSGDEAATMCGPGFDPRFYFFWPRATLHRQDKKVDKRKRKQVSQFHCTQQQVRADEQLDGGGFLRGGL